MLGTMWLKEKQERLKMMPHLDLENEMKNTLLPEREIRRERAFRESCVLVPMRQWQRDGLE